jgi:SAM-dependent methyltransferase
VPDRPVDSPPPSPRPGAAADPRADEAANRRFWDAESDDYQSDHDAALRAAPLAWGPFRIPETELQVLGDLTGLDVLEYGCGAGQWSVALAAAHPTARIVGLDISERQLRHVPPDSRVARVCASATETPFPAASFDVVFCDHGAMSFCDPARTVPELGRLLRPGGRAAFAITAPLLWWTYDAAGEVQTDRLHNPAFGGTRWHVDGGTIDHVALPGEWIRRFRAAGLVAVDCIEVPVPAGATTTYEGYIDPHLGAHWPFEQIWIAERPR